MSDVVERHDAEELRRILKSACRRDRLGART